jgi:hypothetical protein
MNIGELIATLGIDTKQLDHAYSDMEKFERQIDSSVKKINERLDTIGKQMQKVGKNMTRYLTLPITVAGGFAFKMASDMEESINKVDVAFGSSAEYVKQWSKTTLDSIGLASGSALDMAALFGDMSTSMGFATDTAAAMSTNLVQLAGDLASFKNISIDIAQTALSGIFTGETESLKRLGIVMTEINLQEYALNKGITKRIKNMTQAEKVQLRYNYILEMTKNSQGDFARTSESAANQLRTFRESLKEIGIVFGQVLLPVITPMIKSLNQWMQRISKLNNEQKKWILRIAAATAAIGPLLKIVGFLSSNVFPLLVTAGGAAIKMFNLLRIAMLSNPFTAAAIAIGFVVSALIMMKNRTNEVTAAQKALDTVNKTALSNIAEQKSKVEQLIRIAKSEHASLQQRKAAIEELNKVSPKYFGNLSLETINTAKATKAKEAYVKELLREAKVKAAQEKLIELEKRAMDELVLGEANHLSLLQSLVEGVLINAGAYGNAVMYANKKAGENFNKTKNEIESTREALQTFIDSLLKVEDISGTMGAGGGVDLGITGGGGIEDFLKMKQELSDTSWSSAISESARSVRADIKDALWLGDINESIFGTAEAFENMGERMRVVIENTPIENLRQSLANMSKELIDMGADSKGILDFARNVATAGKKIIATYLAEGVAGAVKNALSDVPFPFNLIAAGIAGGAAAALFNGLVPSFAEGGIVNGPTMAMIGDNPAGREAIVPLEKANEFGFGSNRQRKTTRTLVHEISGRNLRILLQEEEDFLSNVT